MIDLHTHVLPGLDDGAEDVEASLAILRASAADGVRVMAGTPHVRNDYPTRPEAMEAALAAVREALAGEDLEIDVVGGGELALDWISGPDGQPYEGEALDRFSLGASRAVLIEFPYGGWPLQLPRTVARLVDGGRVPVVAHPERSADIVDRPERVEEIVDAGALVQLTASSVDGRAGRELARCSRRLLELGLAHLVASDTHGADVRGAGLSSARDAVGGALGEWLVGGVPAALLAGRPVPPRPPAARRRPWWRRRA